ncbi:MAG: sn-glycerol-3-phosphate ABC transporter ATP-binding protein UgpC [Phycisphaerales bacterium]|nr:sn-glycerol-3-phosphate ABC transporter ATP-binding protein UgpC [Phycisphaerales bacterium]
MAQVVLRNVGKVYDRKVRAVEGFNLDIRDGEFVVFVGPSGCGKSTTLRMIAGLEDITEGTVDIGGRVVNHVHPKDRDIAMVFQNYALYPHMTVFKNLAFGLMLRKMPKEEIRRRVGEAARLLGIEQLLERKPKALSGGQRQRVALGRAIVREPQVFLFDEPLSNLDAKLRVVTRTELKNLHQRLRTTTIYVTHDQEEAMTLGDRIVVMSNGRIQQVDTPLNVYRRPVNRFVAAFLGSPPMNFVEGTIAREGQRPVFVGGDWLRLALPADQPGVAADLARHEGRPLVLGFRPNAMSEHAAGKFAPPGGGNALRLATTVVEPLGDKIDVSCQTPAGQRLIARIDARDNFPAGQTIEFFLDPEHVHVFEPGEFGPNILRPPA